MQFYDATNKRAICQEIDRLCDSDDTSYPRLDKTARANDALETVGSWIITADGLWQFDDETYSTNPVGTSALTTAISNYSFSDKLLAIEEIAILDLNGVYRELIPIDASELGDMTFEEYFGITSAQAPVGFPTYYDKVGNSIKLDRSPTATFATLAARLRVKFKRTMQLY